MPCTKKKECNDYRNWLQVYQALIVAGLVSPADSFERLNTIQSSYQKTALNSFEQDVEQWLKKTFGTSLGSIESQVVIAGIATDFVVTRGNKRLVIECDGDQYHLVGGPDGGQRLGCDIIQDRVLERFGYTVLHILSSEFQNAYSKLALAQEITKLLY